MNEKKAYITITNIITIININDSDTDNCQLSQKITILNATVTYLKTKNNSITSIKTR